MGIRQWIMIYQYKLLYYIIYWGVLLFWKINLYRIFINFSFRLGFTKTCSYLTSTLTKLFSNKSLKLPRTWPTFLIYIFSYDKSNNLKNSKSRNKLKILIVGVRIIDINFYLTPISVNKLFIILVILLKSFYHFF